MGKLLANPPKLKGFSKNKVVLVCGIITVILLWLIVFGNNSTNKNKQLLEKGNKNEDPVDTPAMVDSVLAKVEQSSLAKLVMNGYQPNITQANLAQNSKAEIKVPPIESNHNLNAYEVKTKEQFNEKKIDKEYSSLNAKTLMFTQTPNMESGSGKLELKQAPGNTVTNDLHKPAKGYLVKAGSVIPAITINGINSDLPGQVVAIVRQNIYDSITGQSLLIPQGSKLLGLYDSNIVYGQERLIVIWNKLTYPNGYSVNLKGMPGTDLMGYEGFHDIVDNKYAKLFGMSFVMGVITGAMQYSQNSTNNTVQAGGVGINTAPSVGQTMAGSLGQQLGQTGLNITNKNLNVQPTLIIRPNYPFNIMVTADLKLQPYNTLN